MESDWIITVWRIKRGGPEELDSGTVLSIMLGPEYFLQHSLKNNKIK